MWTEQVRSMIGTGILETLYMTVVSTVFGYLFGLPMIPYMSPASMSSVTCFNASISPSFV
jgi:ABC-type methionine transport system permease subunit